MKTFDHWQPGTRAETLRQLAQAGEWDMLIVGGGITGAGILREAARRKLKCLLVEQQDFAWGSSSRSSKMVHGGLRYLASGDFGLTRDAVRERTRFMREAPGLVDNLHFLMPHFEGGFPGPQLFSKVLAVYDFMADRQNHEFYSAATVNQWLSGVRAQGLLGATRFADAITDDARLTLRVLDEARLDGGLALNYLDAVAVLKTHDQVSGVRLYCELGRQTIEIKAKVVVNATGAWSDALRSQLGASRSIRPLRGSHLLVPFWRLPLATTVSFPHPRDKRPVFAFPWLGATVIGTTDLDHEFPLAQEAAITSDEVDYLLAGVNHILPETRLGRADIRSAWAGVRPVVGGTAANPSKEKREHVIWVEQGLISVAGGKLTTFRRIALDVLAHAARILPQAGAPAPDAVFVAADAPDAPRPCHIDSASWQRLLGYYGRRIGAVLDHSHAAVPGTPYLWAELQWAAANEAVQHLDDLLLRRTRLGLLLANGGEALAARLKQQVQPLLGWNDERWHEEWQRYMAIWRQSYSIHA